MSGSPEYLGLLDYLAITDKDPALPLQDPDIAWESLPPTWDLVVADPTHEGALLALAHIALRLYAKERGASFADVILTSRNTHLKKNAGYAGADNEDPWANFRLSEAFGVSAHLGAMIRLSDKYIRIQNLRSDPSNEQVGESILDTLLDLAAYCLIAICLLRETRRNRMN